jgi:hypothetical protein
MNEGDAAFCRNCGSRLAHAATGEPRSSFTHPARPGPGEPVPGIPPGPGGQQIAGSPRPAEVFRLDIRRLSPPEQTVAGASLVVFISLFLPWFGISGFGATFTMSGTSAHGYLYLEVILALLVFAYLVARAGWDQLPLTLPIAHGPLLLIGSGLQFLLVFIGFIDKPASVLSWEVGAYLALVASAVAAAIMIIPAVRSWQASR